MSSKASDGIDAVVFDLDGTLIDSAPDLHGAVNRFLTETDRPHLSLDDIKRCVGDGVRKLMERVLAATGGPAEGDAPEAVIEAAVAGFMAQYEGHGTELSAPFPGVLETLGALRDAGLKLAVCTNKPDVATREILDAFRLTPFFGAIVGGESLPGVRKPDPRHPLRALELLAVPPARAVMVGDHANDVNCARGAGMAAIACAWGYSTTPVEALGADIVIGRFTELPEALARLS